MSAWTPEAMAKSAELAESLGQNAVPRRVGDTVIVPSRSGRGVPHRVLLGLDGNTQCDCPGFQNHGYCWAATYVQEELMTTAIVPIKVQPPASALPSITELQTMDMVAAQLVEGGNIAIPSNLKTKQDIRAVILAGWEMGVRPMTALRHIAVINGKTEPDGQLMAGILQAKESDARFEIMEDTGESITVRLTRPSKAIIREYTATLADAKKAGLVRQGSNWEKFPRDMLRWHAVKRLCRAYAPDIINGIASVSLGDMPPAVESVDEEDFIDGTATMVADSNLYNEGDQEPEPEPEPIKVSQATQNAIAEAYHKVREARGKDEFMGVVRVEMQGKWPHAFLNTSNRLAALTEAEGFDVLAFLHDQMPEDDEDDFDIDGETPQGALFEANARD